MHPPTDAHERLLGVLLHHGLIDLASRVRAAEPINYRAAWIRELKAGANGQRLSESGTWRLDGLWSAACLQARAESIAVIAVMLADTIAPNEGGLDGLIDSYEQAWREAHASAITNTTLAARAGGSRGARRGSGRSERAN